MRVCALDAHTCSKKGMQINWKKPIWLFAMSLSAIRSHNGPIGTPIVVSLSPSAQNSLVIRIDHSLCNTLLLAA